MPVKRASSLYNDPSIGAVFENLASMFAPPQAADVLNYTKARAERDAAQRAADLYAKSIDPNVDQATRDRYIQGVTADFGKTSARYSGEEATKRYGYDVKSRTNLDQTRMQQQGETLRATMNPIVQGATRHYVPALQSMFNVPEFVSGNIELKPGEITKTPDGRTLTGAPVPLTMEQMKASVFAGMPVGQQQAMTFGTTPTQTVETPEGLRTRTTLDAITRDMTPYVNKGATAGRKDGTAIINGVQVPVTRAPDGLQWQLPDGSPVPAGATVSDMPKPTGTPDQLGMTMANKTDANRQAASITGMRAQVGNVRSLLQTNPGIAGAPGAIKGVAQDVVAVAQELTAYGKNNPDAPISLEEAGAAAVRAAERIAPGARNENIRVFNRMISDLAYASAKLSNPSGEVSRIAYETSLKSLGAQGFLASNQTVLDALKAVDMQLDVKEKEIGVLRNPAAGAGAAPATAGAPAGPREGQTATNPQTGEKLVFRNGAWGKQ